MPTSCIGNQVGPTSSMAQRAIAVFPGGSLGESSLPPNMVIVLARGSGTTVWDTSGQAHLDFTMGWGSVLLGHAHPAVTEAVTRQASLASNFAYVNEPALELGEELLRAVPCAERIRFCASGSEATNYAAALARAFTQRAKILKFEGAYHGAHDIGATSLYPRRLLNFPQAEPMSDATTPDGSRDILVAPFNDEACTAAILQRHRDDIAAVIVEPLHRSTPPLPGFLQALRTLTKEAGALLIFDETVTGFRLAYGGAQEYYDVRPDLAALGKALGGGYPIGVVAGRSDIMALFCEDRAGDPRYAYFASTLGGNPVSMAAALATLGELRRPGIYEHLFSLGEALRSGLRKVFNEEGVAAQVLGDGSLAGVAFTPHEIVDYRTFFRSDRVRRRQFMLGLFSRGIFLNPNSSKLYLSCAHTTRDIDQLLDVARDTIRKDIR